MNCGQVDQPEGGLFPDDNPMTDPASEEEFKTALIDIAGTIIPVHPSVDKDNGWVEEVFVIQLRQIAREVLEKYKITY